MSVESYRRRVRRYEFGKRALMMLMGVTAFVIAIAGLEALSLFTFRSAEAATTFLLMLVLLGVLFTLVYTVILYGVLRVSRLDSVEIVRYDLVDAAAAFGDGDLDLVWGYLRDLRWMLNNHPDGTVSRAVKNELLSYIETVDDTEDHHRVLASTFEEFYVAAIELVGPIDGGDSLQEGATDRTGRHVSVGDAQRRRVRRFVTAKRFSLWLGISFILLPVIAITLPLPDLVTGLVAILIGLVGSFALCYAIYNYLRLRVAGVDIYSVAILELPETRPWFTTAGLTDILGRMPSGPARGSGGLVSGAVGRIVTGVVRSVADGVTAVISTVRRLYRFLWIRLHARRSARSDGIADPGPIGTGELSEEPFEGHDAPRPDRAVPSVQGSTEDRSGPPVRATERSFPISGYWMVLGGSVAIGLPLMALGKSEFALGLIGTIFSAYSLRLQIRQ